MNIWSLFGGEELAAAAFKRIEAGWAYQTPPLWRRAFGLAPQYRVDDALKAQLTAAFVRSWRFAMLSVIVGVILAIPFSQTFPVLRSGYDLAIYAAFGGLWGAVSMLFYSAWVRRLLQGAEPVTEKIRWIDQQRAITEAMPIGRLVFFLTIDAVLLTALVLAPGANIPFAHRLAGLIVFGGGGLYFAGVLGMKLARRWRA